MGSEILSSRLRGTKLVIETAAGVEEYDSRFLVAALLVFVARGSGRIEPEEAASIIGLIEEHFHMEGAETLELVTRAMSQLAEQPTLPTLLADLGPTLSAQEKEDIALMGLKVVAAEGGRNFAEMEQYESAMQTIGVPADAVHRAFDRYFEETMPGV